MARLLLLSALVLTLAVCINADTRAVEEEIIKSLLENKNYNKHVRPPGQKNANITLFGLPYEVTGEPTVVTVNMFVRHISEINDDTKDYQISLTIRQSWSDVRLRYTNTDPNLKYILLTDPTPIWVPDLFFSNEKEGHAHDLMTPNTLIRITPKGDVLYSTRVSLTLTCGMDFRNFPMDKQSCSIRMASYAYTTKDLLFIWKDNDPVQSALNLDLSPYEMQGFGIDYCNSKTSTGEYSCLRGEFLFIRQLSTYLMHSYLPLGLLVVASWLTFWLDERLTTLRVLVALITFIATIVESSRVSADAPHSGETKAIDSWTSWTLFFVFLALLEEVAVILVSSRDGPTAVRRTNRELEEGGVAMTPLMEGTAADGDEKKSDAPASLAAEPNLVKKWLSQFNSTGRRIDVIARVVFPITFLIFNLTYWSTYADYKGIQSLSVIKKIPYNN